MIPPPELAGGVVMTITELINLLEEARAEVGDDAEIQLATQASYPLRYDLRGLYVEPDNDDKPTDDLVVWLVEGQQDRNNPYDVPEYAFADAPPLYDLTIPPRGRLGPESDSPSLPTSRGRDVLDLARPPGRAAVLVVRVACCRLSERGPERESGDDQGEPAHCTRPRRRVM